MINTGASNIGAERKFLTLHWNNHFGMVKYTIAKLQAMVGAKPTVPVDKIHKRPTFSTLWHLQLQLFEGLRKVGNVKFPLGGHSGYILSKEAFDLFSGKEWRDPRRWGSTTKSM